MDKESLQIYRQERYKIRCCGQSPRQVSYLADEPFPNALFGAVLFSPHANAVVKKIDVSEASRIEGVEILTYLDAPNARYNGSEWFPGQDDYPDETVLTGHARHVGDRIALVMADTEEKARKARDLVRVEYEILPAVTLPETAADMAGMLHEDGVKSFLTAAYATEISKKPFLQPLT